MQPLFYGSAIERDKIRSGHITRALSKDRMKAVVLHNPCVLRGSQIERDKIRRGYITDAFSGHGKLTVLLRSRCMLGGPQ